MEDNNKTRLSHSAVSKFQVCPKSFDYHYNQGLRSSTTTGALLFGSAIDKALTTLVSKSVLSAESVFTDTWTNMELNHVMTYIPTYTKIVYSDSDADKDLLTKEAHQDLETRYGNDWEESLNKVIQKKKLIGFKYIKKEEKEILNVYNWWCLLRKGHLMVDAVRKQILPKIKEVLGTQVYVELENTNSDKVIGYADLVCRYGDNLKPIVMDWKTSSIDYEEDSVLTSPQLSLYVHALSSQFEDTRQAGFIVLHKRIIKNKKKICSKCNHDGTGGRHVTCNNTIQLNAMIDKKSRCDGEWIETIDPEVRIQVIISEIPRITEDLIIENIDSINTAIKTGNFTRNLGSCHNHFGKCAYFDKCWRGSNDGLIKVN